ncbi:MAG: hypothetical protein PHC56_09805 [Herbinix sp.]|nr:hypothetical protein [Herbinix sp.]
MENTKAQLWLKERQISLNESFHSTLMKLAYKYISTHPGMTLSKVYCSLGISKQSLYWWETRSHSVQTKKNYKRKLIIRAAELFELNNTQTERLANQAGLSLEMSTDFSADFRKVVSSFSGSIRCLCNSTMISERMMEYYMCAGKSCLPSKLCIIAVAIALGQAENEVQSFHRQGWLSSVNFNYS